MNERQIDYFLTVAEEMSINRASSRLPLSLSALSRQIQSLEHDLGVDLFTRMNNGLKLTQAGEIWLQHMRQLKLMLGQAGNDVRRAAQGLTRRVDIGVVASGANIIGGLQKMLACFTASHPDVELVLHDLPTRRQQIEALQEGRILAAFNAFSPEMPNLGTEVLAQDPLWVVVNPRHPLANRPAIHLSELRGVSMIGAQELRTAPPAIERAFRHHDVEPRIEHRTSDVFSFLGMTACGLGFSLLPPSLQALRFPGVVFRPLLADIELTVSYDCVYLKNQSSPLLAALLESVRAYRALPGETR